MRLLFTTLLGIATVMAQDSPNAIPRNETALLNALAGIGRKPVRLTPNLVRIAPPAPRACSVALRVVPIEKPDQFAIRRVPTKDVAPMPQVSVPAPPCETTAR